MTLLQLFYKFLKDNNIFYLYFKNIRIREYKHWMIENVNNVNNMVALNLFTRAFEWESTKEGFGFWEKINCQWETILYRYFHVLGYEKKTYWLVKTNRKMKNVDAFINVMENTYKS